MINPIKNKDLRKIGKLSHAHGLRGELYLLIFSKDYNWFVNVSEIYIEDKNKHKDKESKNHFQCHKIKSFRPHKEGILVTLDGINDRNKSDELSGKEVWVLSGIFVTEDDDDEIFLVEIEGFEVYDGEKKIGKNIGFSYNGANDLLIVRHLVSMEDVVLVNEQYEIPFVEPFIEDIDYDKKIVIMKLPEGLIEVQKEQVKSLK